jgi:hypothetical protein
MLLINKYLILKDYFSFLTATSGSIGRLLTDLADVDRCAGLLRHLLAVLLRNLLAFFLGNCHTLLLRNL